MGDAGSGRGALAGFLAMCFAVVGFTGVLAGHVGQLPLERAVAREAVLDQVVALARAGDQAGLAGLKPLLGDSAAVLAAPAERIEAAVAAERVAMRARQMAEAQAIGLRLRVMMGLVTLLGGAFGVAMLLAASRGSAPRGAPRVADERGIG